MSGILTVLCAVLYCDIGDDDEVFDEPYIIEVPFENEEEGRYLIKNTNQHELDAPLCLASKIWLESPIYQPYLESQGDYCDVRVINPDLCGVFSEGGESYFDYERYVDEYEDIRLTQRLRLELLQNDALPRKKSIGGKVDYVKVPYLTVRGETPVTENLRSYYEGVMEQFFTENVV